MAEEEKNSINGKIADKDSSKIEETADEAETSKEPTECIVDDPDEDYDDPLSDDYLRERNNEAGGEVTARKKKK